MTYNIYIIVRTYRCEPQVIMKMQEVRTKIGNKI